MRVNDIFNETIPGLELQLGKESKELVQKLFSLCDVFYDEVQAIDVELEYDEENYVLRVALSFEDDEITIKNSSVFWEIIDLTDGLEICYHNKDSYFSEIAFSVCLG